MNDLITCTCNSSDQRVFHGDSCALWFDEDFSEGRLEWDPISQVLVITPEYVDWVNGTDEVLDAPDVDLFDVVLLDMSTDGELDVELKMDAVNYIGHDVAELLDFLYREPDEVTMEQHEMLEEWVLNIHTAPDKYALPTYDCYCFVPQPDCQECGVRRVQMGTGACFIPTPLRLEAELKMFLEGAIYVCVCKNNGKRLICTHCGVQRMTGDTTYWTYYDANGFASKAPASGSKSISAYDGWDESGWYTGVGGATVTYQKCRHYSQEVVFPDGTMIWASSSHDRKDDERRPDFGIYMYDSWPNDVLAYKLNWKDFGLPVVSDDVVWTAAANGLAMARDGKLVEIGCMGGHGRTGTFMAIMGLLAGVEGDKAIDWVHDNYCKEAIEGDTQKWYIAYMDAALRGVEPPKRPCTYAQHKTLFEKKEECDCPAWAKDKELLSKPPSTSTAFTSWDLPVYDATPVPSRGSSKTCDKRRHAILYWRFQVCEHVDCTFWDVDVKEFEEKKTFKRRHAPFPTLIK